jgi:uncharacterized protein with HEPN domain
VKDDRLYLVHIGECIARIEQFTSEGKDAFMADAKTQDAVLRNLQTLAESTQRLSETQRRPIPTRTGAAWPGFAMC